MTLVEITQYRIRRTRSATEGMASLDWWMLARLGVWVVFCVLLILA